MPLVRKASPAPLVSKGNEDRSASRAREETKDRRALLDHKDRKASPVPLASKGSEDRSASRASRATEESKDRRAPSGQVELPEILAQQVHPAPAS